MALIHISTLSSGLEIWTISNPLPYPTVEAELIWDDEFTPATFLSDVYVPAEYFQVVYVRAKGWGTLRVEAQDVSDKTKYFSALVLRAREGAQTDLNPEHQIVRYKLSSGLTKDMM